MHRLVALGLALPLASLAACAPSVADTETIATTSGAVLGGEPSDASDDAVVLLLLARPGTEQLEVCTGTLIAPRLVLTARHCVAETDLGVACSSEGTPIRGGAITKNRDPRSLYVFTGKDRPVLGANGFEANGRGLEILDDGAKNLCDHDIALLLLEAPIDGITPARLRLEGTVAEGEKVTAVGWGVTSTVAEPETRQRRSEINVVRIGPAQSAPAIGPNELLIDESICLGDSGGPIFAETGAVVGVVSRGGNGDSPSETEPAATCVGATNLVLKLAPFKSLFDRGFARAGAEPLPEIESSEDDGGGCTASSKPLTQRYGSLLAGAAAFALVVLRARARRASEASEASKKQGAGRAR